MAVAIDSNPAFFADATAATTLSLTTFTVGAGSNRALAVFLTWDRTTTSVTAGYPRWDDAGTPQPMTQAVGTPKNSSDSSQRTEIWGLLAPTSGNKTLKVNWTTSAELIIEMISFTGADPAAVSTTFAHGTNASGTGTSLSVAVTSATGNYTIGIGGMASDVPGSPTQTQVCQLSGAGAANSCSSVAAGAATVTHTYTTGTSHPWCASGCEIVAVGAAGGGATLVPYQPKYQQAPVMAQ